MFGALYVITKGGSGSFAYLIAASPISSLVSSGSPIFRTSNERSPRKYSADPLRACNTYNNGHPLVALFFDCEWKFARFLCAKDQALSKRLSKKFVGVVFTLEVALTNIAKIAIYRKTYNFSCSEMKSQKTAAFYMAETGKIVGIVLGNHRKSMKNFRKQN